MSNTEDHQRRHGKTLTKTEEQRQSINLKGCQKLELQQHNGQCQILTRNSRKHIQQQLLGLYYTPWPRSLNNL